MPEKQSYKDACLRSSKDMINFKRDKDYVGYVGNDTRGNDVVSAFDKVVKLPYIAKNDLVGNPVLHNGKSAGTLRFMKVVQDLNKFNFKDVVEIGGGYGGQCLVMKELRSVNYTIIDIPEALELSRAYLENYECSFISAEDVPKIETDLLISDYCLSELDKDGVDFYLERIRFKIGYFTINSGGEMRNYLINKLREFCVVDVVPEKPKTTHHNNYIIYALADNNL